MKAEAPGAVVLSNVLVLYNWLKQESPLLLSPGRSLDILSAPLT